MSLPVRCTGCGFAFNVADQYAGRKGKCPRCSAILLVSKVALPVAEVLRLASAVEHAREPTAPLSNGSRARHVTPAPWFWPLSTGIIAVVVLAILLGILPSSRYVQSSTRPPVANPHGGPLLTVAGTEPNSGSTSTARSGRHLAGSGVDSPPPPPVVTTAADKAHHAAAKQKLHDLFGKATAFEWKPAKSDEYLTLANLALAMSNAKDPESPAELGAAADDLFGEIKKVAWTADHIEAINQYAIDHLETAGEGVVFVGPVKANKVLPNGDILFLFLIGSTPAVVTTADHSAANLETDARMLVFGRITDQKAPVNINGQASRVQVIVAHYMMPLP